MHIVGITRQGCEKRPTSLVPRDALQRVRVPMSRDTHNQIEVQLDKVVHTKVESMKESRIQWVLGYP